MNFRKVIITSLVGSIGIAVLSLSLSIAWFATSENLYLDTLEIKVSGEQQLLISTSGEEDTFVESLKYRIEDQDNDLNDVGLFQPVSSMFKSEWLEDDLKTEPEFYIYKNPEVTGVDNTPIHEKAEWGYYHQHLYLYCPNSVYATIDSQSLALNEIDSLNRLRCKEMLGSTWTEEHDKLLEDLNAMKNCMRIALYDVSENKFYIIDPYKTDDTLLGGRMDLLARGYYDSYLDLNDMEKYEVIYGEVTNRDKAYYEPVRDTDSDEPEKYTSFSSRTEKGVHEFVLEKSEGLEIKKEDSLALDEVEKNILISLESGQPKEIELLIYMEGWDLDCTNSHMGANFNVDLQFKVSEQKQ